MTLKQSILVLHGPNLNLLGEREPDIYGTATMADINAAVKAAAALEGIEVDCRQSNHEGDLIDWIQKSRATSHGLIINPAGLSHTSVSLADAIAAYPHPTVEVHLSNIAKREGFRHHSYVSSVAMGVISGLGPLGYELAVRAVIQAMNTNN